MNIYFSCSITGGRQDEAVYQAIVDFLLAAGHEVELRGFAAAATNPAWSAAAPPSPNPGSGSPPAD